MKRYVQLDNLQFDLEGTLIFLCVRSDVSLLRCPPYKLTDTGRRYSLETRLMVPMNGHACV